MADKAEGKFFCVRDLPEETRKKIKVYAAQNDLTMAQAIASFVDLALAKQPDNNMNRQLFGGQLQGIGEKVVETALPLSARPAEANRIFMLWFEWFAASQPALAGRIRDYAGRRKLSIPGTVMLLMASGKSFVPNANPPVLEKFGGLTDEELKTLEDISASTER